MKKLLAAAVIAAAPFAAMAGTVSDPFNIEVTVVEYCELGTGAGTITINDYNPMTGSYTQGNGSSTFNCVNGTTYTFSVPSSATLTHSTDPTSTLDVTINTTVDNTDTYDPGTGEYTSDGTTTLNYTVDIPSGQTGLIVGTYSGTVTATITY